MLKAEKYKLIHYLIEHKKNYYKKINKLYIYYSFHNMQLLMT